VQEGEVALGCITDYQGFGRLCLDRWVLQEAVYLTICSIIVLVMLTTFLCESKYLTIHHTTIFIQVLHIFHIANWLLGVGCGLKEGSGWYFPDVLGWISLFENYKDPIIIHYVWMYGVRNLDHRWTGSDFCVSLLLPFYWALHTHCKRGVHISSLYECL